MSASDIKVTDRRMFTPDGELRPEYRFLEGAGPTEPQPPPPARPDLAPPELAPQELAPPPGGPSFFDLLSLIAEPASIYLGDLPSPDGQVGEDLDMAALHIELLAVLRHKTAGNLSAEESSVLDDVLDQLHLRYLAKRR